MEWVGRWRQQAGPSSPPHPPTPPRPVIPPNPNLREARPSKPLPTPLPPAPIQSSPSPRPRAVQNLGTARLLRRYPVSARSLAQRPKPGGVPSTQISLPPLPLPPLLPSQRSTHGISCLTCLLAASHFQRTDVPFRPVLACLLALPAEQNQKKIEKMKGEEREKKKARRERCHFPMGLVRFRLCPPTIQTPTNQVEKVTTEREEKKKKKTPANVSSK